MVNSNENKEKEMIKFKVKGKVLTTFKDEWNNNPERERYKGKNKKITTTKRLAFWTSDYQRKFVSIGTKGTIRGIIRDVDNHVCLYLLRLNGYPFLNPSGRESFKMRRTQ